MILLTSGLKSFGESGASICSLNWSDSVVFSICFDILGALVGFKTYSGWSSSTSSALHLLFVLLSKLKGCLLWTDTEGDLLFGVKFTVW